jgi:hypothetical protein
MARSIFDTSTFKNARVAIVAGAAVAILNILAPVIIDFFPAQTKAIGSLLQVVNTLAGFAGITGGAGAVVGRANKSIEPVETPAWMPGFNPGEIAEQQVTEGKLDQILSRVGTVTDAVGAPPEVGAVARAIGNVLPDDLI